jgi:hypothetical protein
MHFDTSDACPTLSALFFIGQMSIYIGDLSIVCDLIPTAKAIQKYLKASYREDRRHHGAASSTAQAKPTTPI